MTPPLHYRSVCISAYTSDIDAWDAKVAQARALGFTSANRSSLIRLAMAKLDLSSVSALERVMGAVAPAEIIETAQQPPSAIRRTAILCARCGREFVSASMTRLPTMCRQCAKAR